MKIIIEMLSKKVCYGVFAGVVFIFLHGCYSTSTKNNTRDELKNNKYLGKWHSVEREYPFGAVMELDSNYIFTYRGGACVLHFESEGSWALNGDTLVLNSFEPEGCWYLGEFGVNCIIVNAEDTVVPKRMTSIEGYRPDREKEYILFKNERFIVKDSILTHIYSHKLCPDIKDDFIKIEGGKE